MAPVWALSMPWQGWNTLYLFLAALLLLWTIHAVRRLVKVFRLRASVLSSRMVQVRGLGSYLEYFSSATAQHVNYMIHTRQVEPPTTVRNLHVPFTLQSVKLHPGGQLEMEMWSSVPCRVMIMSYMRSDVFKAKAASDSFDFASTSPVLSPNNKKVIPAAGGSSSSSSGHLWWVDQLRQRSTGGPSKEHFLQRSGCCEATSTTMEVPTGTRVVRVQVPMPLSASSVTADNFPLSPLTASAVAVPSRGDDGDVDRIDVVVAAPADDVEAAAPAPGTVLLGVLVVPLGPPAHSTSRLSPSSALPAPAPSPSAGSWPGVGEEDDGSGAGRAPLEFGLAVLSAPANLLPQSKVSLMAPASPPPLPADTAPAALAPVEFIMSVAGGTLLTAVEIFGLGSVQAQVPGNASGGFLSAAFTSPEKLQGTGGGGGGGGSGTADSGRGDDECVVCLEASKEVLLLPCRHMCVCSTCLTHIDKCPVCRATFEEYIQMLRERAPQQDGDDGSAGADKNAPNSNQGGGAGLLTSIGAIGGVARRIDFADAEGTNNTASI